MSKTIYADDYNHRSSHLGTKERPRLADVDYDYSYPNGLKLKPGTPQHDKLRDIVLDRARSSYDIIKKRHDTWHELDRVLTAYVDLDAEEERIKEKDNRKAVSIVVPTLYAILDTLLTYQTAAFLGERPIFQFDSRDPRDTVPAALMELLVDWQCQWTHAEMALHTQWRDAWVYGFGVISPVWHQEHAFRTVMEPEYLHTALGSFEIGVNYVRTPFTSFEGNRLDNIDTYMTLPDPNVPIHEVQKGAFFGWIMREDLTSLLTREANGDVFNVKYMKHTSGTSVLFHSEGGTPNASRVGEDGLPENKIGRPVDVIWLYADIVPSDFDLGPSSVPEKWLFGLAGDQVIIQAAPLHLDHNRYPVAVYAPDTDGRAVTPVSKMEMAYPEAHTIDYLFASRIANLRRTLNDRIVVDPSMVNMDHVVDSRPGGYVALLREYWGVQGATRDAVTPMPHSDVTQGHVRDAMMLTDIARNATGATDIMQGIMRTGGERRSATEARGARTGGLSRLEKAARLCSVQSMFDLGFLLASQTQQLMSQSTALRVLGRNADQLRAIYGGNVAMVGPLDIQAEFDVVPKDGTMPNGDYAESWVQLFQQISASPELIQQFDTTRIFMHIARMLGAKNLEDFVRNGPPVQSQVMGQDQVQQGVDAGNLAPVGEMGNALVA